MSQIDNDMDQYLRAANFLTAAQIFLQDNFLMERELTFDDVKPRLLGHWGSGPGVNLAYAHLNKLIKKYDQEMMFVLGPGHAFPALQANLFMEGTLTKFYPEVQQNYDGIAKICREFSWPYGFPSHSNPGTPGVILEGGELGYALSTSYGAVMDNRNLIVACLVGDGEAETGPTAGAWHLNKLIDPKTNGTVLPIVHLNGYKISAPTVYGRMSDDELKALFWGYGYEPRIVSGDGLSQQMEEALEWAHHLIWDIKEAPQTIVSPRLPMIVMRNTKGYSGVKYLDNLKVEGNYASHQVVLMEAKTDPKQLALLNEWLSGYNFKELFSRESGFGDYVQNIVPELEKTMGSTPHALGGDPVYKPLILPAVEEFAEDSEKPGTMGSSSMRRAGLYLREVFRLNEDSKNFRFMSPDETYSNKLDEVFSVTSRAWVWPNEEWDLDMSHTGRVMEMLSEHNLQGLTQGYVLTGRHAVFASYEAFIQVVVSMMDQYAKFLNQREEVEWRKPIPSLNYILTSSGWRQDHNGFSHQNPGFIDDALRRQGDFVNVYFPADGSSTLVALEHMLSSTGKINVLIGGKTVEPRWLTPELARKQLKAGVLIWDFASDEDPDVIMAAAGDYPVKETMAAIDLIKTELPEARLRCVNISSLTSCGLGQAGACLTPAGFDHIFTADKPVIVNFHGYPETLKSILFDYTKDAHRFDVRGYIESGSTTTPFDMHVRNKTSRYHLVIAAVERLADVGRITDEHAKHLAAKYQGLIDENTEYIKVEGVDKPEIDAWVWQR